MSPDHFEAELAHTLPALTQFARRLLRGDNARADDLVQDTALKAWMSRESLRDSTAFAPWLRKILRNQLTDQYRRINILHGAAELSGEEAAAPQSVLPEVALDEGLAQLSVSQQNALVEVMVGGASYSDTAKRLGITESAVRSRVCRARAKLRALD
ncbi:MAG: RNA polymerase sigma factor [Pseudomonadota bacterium]